MAAKKPLNIGLVGYGFMGRTHSNGYKRVNDFFDLEHRPVLKAVCGRSAEGAQAFAEKWGYESVETDWRTLVGRKDIDAIDVNGQRFYSAGGLGWVADVAHRANRWRAGSRFRRWLLSGLGHFIYTLACVAVIFGKQRLGAKTTITYTDALDGKQKTRTLDAYGVVVASSKKVGKSFDLVPVSEMDDGRFELILFPRVDRRRLLKTVLWAQRGKLFDIPEIEYLQVTQASISCDRRVRFFGDGEILEHGETFELGIAATPVRIMAPGVAEPAVALHAALQRA